MHTRKCTHTVSSEVSNPNCTSLTTKRRKKSKSLLQASKQSCSIHHPMCIEQILQNGDFRHGNHVPSPSWHPCHQIFTLYTGADCVHKLIYVSTLSESADRTHCYQHRQQWKESTTSEQHQLHCQDLKC